MQFAFHFQLSLDQEVQFVLCIVMTHTSHHRNSFTDYKIGVETPGKYKVILFPLSASPAANLRSPLSHDCKL